MKCIVMIGKNFGKLKMILDVSVYNMYASESLLQSSFVMEFDAIMFLQMKSEVEQCILSCPNSRLRYVFDEEIYKTEG